MSKRRLPLSALGQVNYKDDYGCDANIAATEGLEEGHPVTDKYMTGDIKEYFGIIRPYKLGSKKRGAKANCCSLITTTYCESEEDLKAVAREIVENAVRNYSLRIQAVGEDE